MTTAAAVTLSDAVTLGVYVVFGEFSVFKGEYINTTAIDIGDILVIHDTGAHGHSMGYNYNGKLRSAEVLLKENGSYQLIRRAETPDDYFATFDFSDKYSFKK